MAIFDFIGRKRSAAPITQPAPTAHRSKARYTNARAVMRSLVESAGQGRLTADWLSFPTTTEHVIRMYQRTLVARSREQVLNNDYAKAFIRIVRQNIVGPNGVMLQAQSRDDSGKLDKLANEAIEEAFRRWGQKENCDVAGRQTWRSLQHSAVISLAKDGEYMFRKIYGKDAGLFGFALQMLDPQRCPPDFDQYDLPDGCFIRSGIEFNQYGRPMAFHFVAAKESDAFYNYTYAGKNFHRIPADEIIHGFLPEMVGQKRGLPWMCTGLHALKQLHGFEDAAVINARIGASKMGVIQWKEGQGPELDEDEKENFEMEASPGEFAVLPDGAELHDWVPQYPSGEYAGQVKSSLRRFSSGTGVAYNGLANDLEGVNFSSIRQGTLDERENWKDGQELLIETLMQSVFDAWLPRALLGGFIMVKGRSLKPERIDRYRRVSWQARRWQWVDPQSDVNAAVSSKNNLLMSPGQIIREQGRDPSDVWREIASDIAEMKDAGIPEDFIKAAILDKNLQATTQANQKKNEGQANGQ